MRAPRRISEILKRKELFLDEVRTKLENTTLRLQTDLFKNIIEEIIPRLDVEKGVLLDNAHNYRLISELDRIYETFNVKVVQTILPQINKGTGLIADLAKDYFVLTLTGDLPKRFIQILESTKVLTDLRLGLRMGKMIRGGNLMSMLRIDPLDFKQLMNKAVTSQMDMKSFINVIKENIMGTEEKIGSLERQFRRFAYDTYQQYDAAYNKNLANEFGMKYFIYQGGLIKDSRDFCVCHNGKVFSIEETETWKDWKPADCEYPEDYVIKQKDIYAKPSYMGFVGYDPLVDRGGFNCRHILGYVSDELAFRMRPDLKKE